MFFFFNDTATTEIYTLSLHDALPIYHRIVRRQPPLFPVFLGREVVMRPQVPLERLELLDRKSTRLNSSHSQISYAVFCLKKKKIVTAESMYAESRRVTTSSNVTAYF